MSLAVANTSDTHQSSVQEKNNMSPKHIISVLGPRSHSRAGKRTYVSPGFNSAKDSLLAYVHLFDGF